MTEPTPSIPTSVVVKRKRGRPRKSETEGMPNAINQPSQKRKPKKLKVNSNPLEMFQNITNEDEVVEFEVEKIVNKEVDPITVLNSEFFELIINFKCRIKFGIG